MNSNGLFGFYDLFEWWDTNFTEKEKYRFGQLYKPLGGSFDSLISGNIETKKSAVWFLTSLAGFITNKDDVKIALKFLEKAEEMSMSISAIDKHFMYAALIRIHYYIRENTHNLLKAKHYCFQMIAISSFAKEEFSKEYDGSLPRHLGYHQLSIILEKESDFNLCLEICEKAKSEGWKGDWEKSISRLSKKI